MQCYLVFVKTIQKSLKNDTTKKVNTVGFRLTVSLSDIIDKYLSSKGVFKDNADELEVICEDFKKLLYEAFGYVVYFYSEAIVNKEIDKKEKNYSDKELQIIASHLKIMENNYSNMENIVDIENNYSNMENIVDIENNYSNMENIGGKFNKSYFEAIINSYNEIGKILLDTGNKDYQEISSDIFKID